MAPPYPCCEEEPIGGRKELYVPGEAEGPPAPVADQLPGLGDTGDMSPFPIAVSSGSVPARVGLGGGMTDPPPPPDVMPSPLMPPVPPDEKRLGFGEFVALLD